MRKDSNSPYYSRTNGYPVNQILITQEDKNEEPTVFAFITDAEDDVIEMSFNSDGFQIITEDTRHISGDSVFLSNLRSLAKKGAGVMEYIYAEMEAKGFGDDGSHMPDFSYLVTPARPQNENGDYLPFGSGPGEKGQKSRLIDRAVTQSTTKPVVFFSDPHGPEQTKKMILKNDDSFDI